MNFLGGLASGIGAYFGQREANKTNIKLAQDQMAFQERMSSTSYQRAMKDMELAGLNPMLAYSQGGASTPPGSTTQVRDPVSSAVSSALDYKRTKAEVDNLAETNKNLKAQNELYLAQTKSALEDANLKSNSAAAVALENVGRMVEARIDEEGLGYMGRVLQRFSPLRGLDLRKPKYSINNFHKKN